jgi:hypothetical protein
MHRKIFDAEVHILLHTVGDVQLPDKAVLVRMADEIDALETSVYECISVCVGGKALSACKVIKDFNCHLTRASNYDVLLLSVFIRRPSCQAAKVFV